MWMCKFIEIRSIRFLNLFFWLEYALKSTSKCPIKFEEKENVCNVGNNEHVLNAIDEHGSKWIGKFALFFKQYN
mgnify:CR=1 FL=1